ncbi:FAD-linked oxidase C-terminal domain-containing protein, partial [Marinobacter sp. UBA2498]
FDRFMNGVDAVRQIAQSGLFPSNCRLLDEAEVVINRIADKPCAILVLGFESADHPQDQKIERAVAIAEEHGGVLQKDGISYNPDHAEKGSSEAESWRNAFIRMPYWRNRLTAMGMIADTFETAITWDRFPSLYKAVRSTMESALREITQRPFSFSCRFTHVYPDGPAPYFTFYCVGDTTGDLGKALEKWKQLKRISMEVLAEQGATVTHHHAVGRDHRFGYEQQTSPLFRQTLAAGKHFLDPQGILNPGALFDPQDKNVGIRGVLGD